MSNVTPIDGGNAKKTAKKATKRATKKGPAKRGKTARKSKAAANEEVKAPAQPQPQVRTGIQVVFLSKHDQQPEFFGDNLVSGVSHDDSGATILLNRNGGEFTKFAPGVVKNTSWVQVRV